MQHSERFVNLVTAVKKNIREISALDVQNKLQQQGEFLLVDVREASEWVRGHLPQAMHISKGVMEVVIEKKIPDVNTEIVLYCGGGSRSALAAENLQRMGYSNVFSMAGGFRGWVEAGLTVEMEEVAI